MDDLAPELLSRIADFIPGAKSFASFRLTNTYIANATRFNAVQRVGTSISAERDESAQHFLERIHHGHTILKKVDEFTLNCDAKKQPLPENELRRMHLPNLRELRLCGLYNDNLDSVFVMLEQHATTLRSLHILDLLLWKGNARVPRMRARRIGDFLDATVRNAWIPLLRKLQGVCQLTALRIENLSVGNASLGLHCVRVDEQRRRALKENFDGSVVQETRFLGHGLEAKGGQAAVQNALALYLWELGVEGV